MRLCVAIFTLVVGLFALLGGCAFVQVTDIRLGVETSGGVDWSTSSTSSPYLWTPSLTPTKLNVQLRKGPAAFIEAIQVNATNPPAGAPASVWIPVRQWLAPPAGNGVDTETIYTLEVNTLSYFLPSMGNPGDKAPGSKPETEPKAFGFNATVLWRNSLTQTNYEPGEFNPDTSTYGVTPLLTGNRDVPAPVNGFQYIVTYGGG